MEGRYAENAGAYFRRYHAIACSDGRGIFSAMPAEAELISGVNSNSKDCSALSEKK